MEKRLHHLVGMADLSELLEVAFSLPTPELAEGFASEAFQSDWAAAWFDAAGEEWIWPEGADFGECGFEPLRSEYSRLYLIPGNRVPVWPYENCFIYRAKGRDGVPGLFRSPTLIDVEDRMREAGVLPVDYRTEPADTMFKEFMFLAYLFGKAAEGCEAALRAGYEEAPEADAWEERAADFARAHALAWLPAFMDETAELTRSETYRTLAALGSSYLGLLEEDAR